MGGGAEQENVADVVGEAVGGGAVAVGVPVVVDMIVEMFVGATPVVVAIGVGGSVVLVLLVPLQGKP